MSLTAAVPPVYGLDSPVLSSFFHNFSAAVLVRLEDTVIGESCVCGSRNSSVDYRPIAAMHAAFSAFTRWIGSLHFFSPDQATTNG
jgi:hypothetical protein